MKIRNDIDAVGGTPSEQVVKILKPSVNVIAVCRVAIRPICDIKEFLEIKRHTHAVKALAMEIANIRSSDKITPISIQHLRG